MSVLRKSIRSGLGYIIGDVFDRVRRTSNHFERKELLKKALWINDLDRLLNELPKDHNLFLLTLEREEYPNVCRAIDDGLRSVGDGELESLEGLSEFNEVISRYLDILERVEDLKFRAIDDNFGFYGSIGGQTFTIVSDSIKYYDHQSFTERLKEQLLANGVEV